MPCHLIRYVKTWRKNQNRKDAAVASGSENLNRALEYVPIGQRNTATFEITDLSNSIEIVPATDSQVTENAIVPTQSEGLMLLCSVCGTDQGVQPYNTENTRPKVRKKRRCLVEIDEQKCPDPFNCRGKVNRENCILKHKGDLSKLRKRKIRVKYTKKCRMCGMEKCKGVSNREKCKNINVVAV